MKAERRPKGPGRTMAFQKAPWNSKVHVKAQKKVELTEAESLMMVHVKAQTKAEPMEAESPPKGSQRAQTMI
jgi:hypothetical protein